MKTTTLAKLDHLVRPLITQLPSNIVVSHYSQARLRFLSELVKELPENVYTPPKIFSRILWGIKFRSPLMNAAGMFKNGECYQMVAAQGAAAYLGGTGTWYRRSGNEKNGIRLPFTPYSRSHAASNWLGLPNLGDSINYQNAANLKLMLNCPFGWSVTSSPDLEGKNKLECLVASMELYEQAGVDFLELNESCPTTHKDLYNLKALTERLRYITINFLDQRTRRLPVIVKFSLDTTLEQIPRILDLLFRLGYDGINLGNTSTDYERMRKSIAPKERKLYDFFIKTFGGGVSGRPLKELSLALAARAVDYLKACPPSQEFHVIRTGGIETWEDIIASEEAGISLNHWFTGYFENFAKYGHSVYREIFEG